MATLTVSTTHDYSPDHLSSITLIDFTNPAATSVTASFAVAQFNDLFIAKTVTIDGSAGQNTVVITGQSISLCKVSVTNWGADDRIFLNGTSGNDLVVGTPGADWIDTGLGNDDIFANAADHVLAGDGNDRIEVGAASGALDGGAGIDVIGFSTNITEGLVFDLSDGGGGRVVAGSLTLSGVERVDGYLSQQGDLVTLGDFRDLVQGNNGNDRILSRGGDDYLQGGNGTDRLTGGAGNDILTDTYGRDRFTGGSGADRFIFTFDPQAFHNPNLHGNVITDFAPAEDRIDLHLLTVDTTGPAEPTHSVSDCLFIGQTAFDPYDIDYAEIRYRHTATTTVVEVAYEATVFLRFTLMGLVDLTSDNFLF